MNEHELERLAKQLGRAGDRVDPEATARAVVARLESEPEQDPADRARVWTHRPLVRVAAAAAEALDRILLDPELGQRLGSAGREHAGRSSWEENARQVLAIYAEALG